MRKNFSLKAYFVYVIRYWIVLAVCAVIGLGTGLLCGILSSRDKGYVSYQGNIEIGGVSSFFEELKDKTDNPSRLYTTIKSEAFASMDSQIVRTSLYREVENEWRASYRKLSAAEARDRFYESLTVSEAGPYLYVSFRLREGDFSNEFSAKVVDRYLALATAHAADREPLLASEGKLTVTVAEMQVPEKENGLGVLQGLIIGAVVGVLAALIALFVVYFADKRILSYNDIADISGRRLLEVSKGAVANKVCPLIDCEMENVKILAVCGNEDTCKKLSEMYGEYSLCAGNKPLRLDFSCDGGSDSFGEYMRGAELNSCVKEENGVAVLCGKQSWALMTSNPDKMENLKKVYDKIAVCAPFRNDGSLGVVSKVSDKVVYAIDQRKMRVNDFLSMVSEADVSDKVIGTVIEKAGRSFVGANTYFETEDEE